jgi:hypothetical protein
MTTRGDEKQVEEIVADPAELRASLAEQFSALGENLEGEFAMLKFVFQTRDPNSLARASSARGMSKPSRRT